MYLDDIRVPIQTYKTSQNSDWVIVRSYDEFVNCITENGLPFMISFDHDLSIDHYIPEIDPTTYTEKTGYDCAKWLINYCMDNKQSLPSFMVHSMNPVGAHNIRSLLNKFSEDNS